MTKLKKHINQLLPTAYYLPKNCLLLFMQRRDFHLLIFLFCFYIGFSNTESKNNAYFIESDQALNSQAFTWKNIKKWYPQQNGIFKDISIAQNAFRAIDEQDAWVEDFSNEDIQELPIGIKQTNGNIQYSIGITRARTTPDYTAITVFGRVRIPQNNSNGYPTELFFGANNVKLSHSGGIIGNAKLVLLGDMYIPFNSGNWMLMLKGGFDYRSGLTQDLTYVTIGCDGIKEMAIQGAVEFSRNLVLPVENDGQVLENKTTISRKFKTENGTTTKQVPYRVRGEFATVVTDWNDLLVGITLQPFTLAKKRNQRDYGGNFQFYVNQAIFDFSDLRNAPDVNFPTYYHEQGLLLPSQQSWRGVYINTLEVRLPQEFKTNKSIQQNQRVGFVAHHLIIDNNGISGNFMGNNIFPLNKGRTNKKKAWAYSLDHFEVSLAANKFIHADFNGRILLPVSKKDNDKKASKKIGLTYAGLISSEEYLLNVSNDSIIDFSLWKAKGELLPNSAIELAVREGQFRPRALLNGRLAISASQKDSMQNEGEVVENNEGQKNTVKFSGIVFQNMVLQTEAPIFSVDYMGYQDEVSFGNFPATISNIDITANEFEASLYFDLDINLMDGNSGFAASASVGVLGKFQEANRLQKWRYQGLDLGAIAVDADFGAFTLGGSLTLMKDNPEYGDGFAANLQTTFEKLDLVVAASGIFGKKDFRYWQFEAMASGFEIGSGLLNITGFAGGASYRMRRANFSSNFSPTGIGYVPDENLGLGLKAMVMFSVVKKEAFEGRAGFEVTFNKNSGVDFLGFYGQGTFMNVPIPGMESIEDMMAAVKNNEAVKNKFLSGNEQGQASNSGKNLLEKATSDFPAASNEGMAISAQVGITYDFQNEVLHGEMDTYVNVPGGFLQGRGASGRAGWAVIHRSRDEWYIYIGTPEDRLGLKIGIGPMNIETGSYFMAGSMLPDSPPPPPEVAEILGVSAEKLNYMRKENLLKNGSGFAFGSNLSLNTGDLRFLIFYANLQAGAGFDIMLRDYGKAACVNTGKQVGINGWYANGQAYAYLQGEMGVRIKLFFVQKKIPILTAATAVLLQAKAPNPVWMQGYLATDFSVLGGLVNGRCRFKVTLGKECEFLDDAPLGGIKMIADLTPEDSAGEIDVFTIPQATFAMKVNKPILIPEDSGDKTYRIKLEEFKIMHHGKEIPGEINWNSHHDRADFMTTDILPPSEKFTVKVEVSFEEQVNGVFKAIMVDGKPATETEERVFTTGLAPTAIPLQNIKYAYPVVDQKYFYEDEYDKGYIKLKRGQDYLFDGGQWETFITYTDEHGDELTTHVIYNKTKNTLSHYIPDIKQSKGYHLSIVSKLQQTAEDNATEQANVRTMLNDETTENYATVEAKKAVQNSKSAAIERLTYDFSTSDYNTFKDKIEAINTKKYDWRFVTSDVILLSNKIKKQESFDLQELIGTSFTENKPLVTAEATLDDDYFLKDINPPLYSVYPIGGLYSIKHRKPQNLGISPAKALPIRATYLNNLEHGVNKNMLRKNFPYQYNLGEIYKKDWIDIQSQIANDYVEGLVEEGTPALNFLDEEFKFMRTGFYNINLKYELPGNIAGSNAVYQFKNENNFRRVQDFADNVRERTQKRMESRRERADDWRAIFSNL